MTYDVKPFWNFEDDRKKFGDISNFLTFCFELRARSFAHFKVQDAFGVFKRKTSLTF